MIPQFITFTGLDARTDLDRVKALSDKYPLEWGVLLGGSIGMNRYPDDQTLTRISTVDGLKISMHCCGRFARYIMHNDKMPESEHQVVRDRLAALHDDFWRMQINARSYDIDRLMMAQSILEIPLIMQVRGARFPEPIEGITFLHDQSGGRGVVPKTRPVQEPGMSLVGYAGGIRPDNVLEINSQIKAHTYYLDMETGVRTDDWLDLDKCELVCRQIWP